MSDRSRHRTSAAAMTAALGSLAAPGAAQAMLPPEDGGGPPPRRDLAASPDKTLAEPPVKPAQRDPVPAPVGRPTGPPPGVSTRALQERDVPERPARPVRRDPAPAREPARTGPPPGVTTRQLQERDTPERPASRPTPAPTPVRADPAPAGPAAGPPPGVTTRQLQERDTPKPAAPVRDRPERKPAAPRPEPTAPPAATGPDQVQADAKRYADALDRLDANDGAMNLGTSQAMRLGDDPRVVTRARQIREDEAAARRAEAERVRRAEAEQAENARVLRESQAYMNAQERIKDNGGALNLGLSRALSYGDDPKVKGFVSEYQRRVDQREREAREQERREQTRREAETYLNALDRIEDNGGALSMGLSHNLRLADDPEVKRVADRMAVRREAAEERERVLDRARTYLDAGDPEAPPPEDPAVREAVKELEQKRQTRSDAERYANALDRIDDNGGALNMGLSRTLQEFADDNKVRRLAEQLRAERANEYKEEVFGPLDGPSLRDPKLGVAVPFLKHSGTSAGLTLEQECMLKGTPDAALACVQGPKKPPPVAVKLTGKITGEVTRGNPELADNGTTYETIGVSVDMQAGVQGEGKLPKGVGITLSKYDGATFSYKLRVTSERAEQIANGTVRPPVPIDPDSLRAGESITMDEEAYEGNSQSASYRILKGTLGFQEGRRLSSAVERLPNGRMRILVGDEDFVKHAIELRLGTDDIGVAAGVSKEFASGDLRTVEVNPRNEEGWDAYQHFVTTGTLPATEGRGVRNTTAVEKASWSSSTTLKLNLKAVHVGGSSTPFAGDVTETRHSDGSVDYALTDRHGSVTYVEQAKKELGDEDYGPSEYSLLLQGADSSLAEALTELHGGDVEAIDGDNQNLRLRFSEADLEELRRDAVEQISRYSTEANHDDGMTPAEVEQEAKKGYYDAQFGVPGGAYEIYLRGLATARNPSELLAFVQNSSHGNSSAVVDDLLRLRSVSGSVDVYDD